MRFSGKHTIFPCREYETVAVPIQALMDETGRLRIYPEVAGKGYFDIDYRQGELCLRATRFVGLIPISDNVAIHVEPRVPMAHLLYMIWRSGTQLKVLQGFIRGYLDRPGGVASPEELYVASFLSVLRSVRRTGLLRSYIGRDEEREKRGRLLVGKTIGRFRSRGYRYSHAFEVVEHSTNNPANQIIKSTAERLFRHFAAEPIGANLRVARELDQLLSLFSAVNAASVTPQFVAHSAMKAIRSLPSTHEFYASALWLSYLIATNSGICMQTIGRAQFESVIVDVSDVFEKYVRKVLEEEVPLRAPDCKIVNGNESPVSLFVQGSTHAVHPDYYFSQAGTVAAVADAKYKAEPNTQDRYELLAFCEALNVSRGAFICPMVKDSDRVVKYGTTPGGREISVLRINLAAPDPSVEEAMLAEALWGALKLYSGTALPTS